LLRAGQSSYRRHNADMPSALTAIARMNVSFVETGQLLQPWQQVCRLTE
jgi:hypothetical protein